MTISSSPLMPLRQSEMIAAVNATEALSRGDLLQDGFKAAARRQAAATAVCVGEDRLSYGELAGIARYGGAVLRRLGAGRNRLVAVAMRKGWEQVAGVLSVLMAGAAYLPLDPDWPAERLELLLRDGDVSLVLTQSGLLQRLALPAGIRAVAVDPWRAQAAAAEDVAEEAGAGDADDLAYVIYTSGSTGRPKGVMVSHRAAVNTIADINERFGVGPRDCILAVSALSFDLSVYDIFGGLGAGARLVLPPPAGERDPVCWWDLAEREGVTIWNSAPALMDLLVGYGAAGRRGGLATLRLALLSGDWIAVTLPAAIRALAPACQVVSLGGATEAAIWSVIYPIGQVEPSWTSIPYGRPLRNQRAYVLNEDWQLCPVWVRGMLYLAGAGLAQGYWGDESRTAASFVSHPQTGERLYRTGDLARYRPDGDIELLGREDLQIKLHGHRIEPAEIEAAIARHPAVRASAVVLAEPPPGQLTAFLVGAEGAVIDVDELGAYLAGRLPPPMVPRSYRVVDALPLTPAGHVDRALLARQAQPRESPTPSNPEASGRTLDAQIAGLVAEILAVTSVDTDVRLLDLGADSVSMVRIANRLEQDLGLRPPLELLLDNPTILQIADHYAKAHVDA